MVYSMDRRRQNRLLLGLIVLLWLPLLLSNTVPMQDLPDWVLQGTILSHADSPLFAPFYHVRMIPAPNLALSLILAVLGPIIGMQAAAKIAAALTLLLFTAGFVYLRRADGRLTPHIEVLGALFAANHFYMMGYLNFMLGSGLAFIAVGYYWRRAGQFAKESAAVLAVLATAIYFCHFFAFFMTALAVFCIAWRTYYSRLRAYIAPLAALAPGVLFGLWYALARSGEFNIRYELSPLKHLWFKVMPFAPLSNFYPFSPQPIAWVVVLANIAVVAGLAVLFLWLIRMRAFDPRSPLTIAGMTLAVAGLLAPTCIFELIWPGQRLLFLAFFLLLADVNPPRELRMELSRKTAVLLAALLLFNSANMTMAARQVTAVAASIEQNVPEDASPLLIDTANFIWDKPKTALERLTDPFGYPAWVNPLKAVGYYHAAKHGGLIQYLFPTGVVEVTQTGPPLVQRQAQLSEVQRFAPYEYIVLTGRKSVADRIDAELPPQYREIAASPYYRILKRQPPQPPRQGLAPGALSWIGLP